MKIQDIPQQDRPRERLLRLGAAALSDAELLAVLLGSGCRGKSALDLGSDLLSQFGSIRGIISQPQPTLCQLPGINAASYALIQACHELISRLLREKLTDQGGLYNADDVEDFLVARMSHLPHEVFACIFLNNSNKILSFDILFNGSLNRTSIYPRELIKKCLHYNAARVILVHNHPSGDLSPSDHDISLTKQMVRYFAVIDVEVVDHIIVAGNKIYSIMAE